MTGSTDEDSPSAHEGRLPKSHEGRLPESHEGRLPESHVERLPESHVERLPESRGGRLPESRGRTPPEAQSGRLPDFFIVGHPKSGTTALYEMLRAHPQIFMPDLKEPRYFASDLRERFAPGGSDVHPQTLEDYLALFAPAAPGQVLGEASPSYLRSRVAAGAIAAVRPEGRIVAILREPAGFMRSLHLELVQNRVERERDLRRALEHEQRGGGVVRYTDRVAYVEQLRRFHDAFAAEQVLVLIYDDFRTDNEATVRRVLDFLGVDAGVPLATVEANPSVRVRSSRLEDAVRRLSRGPVARAARSIAPEGVLHGLRRSLLYGRPEAVDERLMRELRMHFKGEVVALSDYLGRDLVRLWGYDELD